MYSINFTRAWGHGAVSPAFSPAFQCPFLIGRNQLRYTNPADFPDRLEGAGMTAYVSGFQFDIFISYAWVDNQPEDPVDPSIGWVSRFRHDLIRRVDQKLGRIGAANVFFDTTQIGKNRDFGPQIEAAVRSSATFVAVFSQGYRKSDACREELRLFRESVSGELSESGRLFVVRLEDNSMSEWPDDIRAAFGNQLIGYQWFRRSEATGRSLTLNHCDKEYQEQLEQLRCELFEKLNHMQSGRLKSFPEFVMAPKAEMIPFTSVESDLKSREVPTVLVAQGTPEMRKVRQALIAYCENASYSDGVKFRVLGKKPYPPTLAQFRAEFESDLEQSHLFVQLLGASYSDRTTEFPEGLEGWQTEAVAKFKLPSLRWRDPNLSINEIDDEAHRKLVSHPDVLREPLAIFHAMVVEQARLAFKLQSISRDKEPERLIILKYSDADADLTREVVEAMTQHNMTCLASNNGLPIVETLREISADALVVVIGDCPQPWLMARGIELLKVQCTFRDQSPLRIYYNSQASQRIPPLAGKGVLEIRGRSELSKLLSAIQQRCKR